MPDEKYAKVIKRQDDFAIRLQNSFSLMHSIQVEAFNVMKTIPAEEIYKKYFPEFNDGVTHPIEILNSIIRFRTENPEKAELLSNELNSFPEYGIFLKKLNEYDEIKYKYYFDLYSYFKMINKDRKALFDKEYTATVDALADRGVFLYFQQTPDLPLKGMSVDEAERFILNLYSMDNYGGLYYSFGKIFSDKSDNPLQTNKTNDLREALLCLSFGSYQSCARTMFALLENEHQNASSLFTRSSGRERADAIDDLVEEMGNDYYEKVWEKINSYYKSLNCDTDKMDSSKINRHDLMHGTYKHIATSEDCVKLILLYASFKDLSFYVQRLADFQIEFTQDTAISLFKMNKKFGN